MEFTIKQGYEAFRKTTITKILLFYPVMQQLKKNHQLTPLTGKHQELLLAIIFFTTQELVVQANTML